jgi:hypothetical protein
MAGTTRTRDAGTRSKHAHVWGRSSHDWYVEPREAVDFLLDREEFVGPVWDPACGQGQIVKACLDRDIEAWGTDIVRRMYSRPAWFPGVLDFLEARKDLRRRREIISNPPYLKAKGAEAYIRRALALPGVEKVAMVVNAKFVAGQGRARGLYAELPPDRVRPISPRPSMPPGEWLANGEKAGGGIEDFVWLVWDRREPEASSRLIWA